MTKGTESFGVFGEVYGVDQVIKNLHLVDAKCARPAVASGLRKALGVYRKAIRKGIKDPSVRATVSTMFRRGRRTNPEIYAKVGGGVGKKGKTKAQAERYGRTRGMHISKYNAQWWFLGTKERAGRGRMWGKTTKPEPVRQALSASSMAARAAIKQMEKFFFKKVKSVFKVIEYRGL